MNMNVAPSKPHPMHREQRLCWLNSSVQLVLSNNSLIEDMLKNPFFTSTSTNVNLNQIAFRYNADQDVDVLSNFHSKLEENTIKYLIDILKSSSTHPLPKRIIEKYFEDLRLYGPKFYDLQNNQHLPLIKPIGEISSIDVYLSQVLLAAIANFIDVFIIWDSAFTCSKCHADNIKLTDSYALMQLVTPDSEGSILPDAALKNYILTDNDNGHNTCNACGEASDQNRYCKEIVQLPDTLFLSFTVNKSTKIDDNHVKPTECFVQSHLDMSTFASSQLVCYPSYFKYQLRSVIVSTGDNENNRHYYTFSKYGEQFYRCNDEFIEPVHKSVVFDRKYSISCVMYVREKINHVNFIDTICQILSDTEYLRSSSSVDNTHVRIMFDAALEHVARDTKILCWSYGAVYTCMQCKESEF